MEQLKFHVRLSFWLCAALVLLAGKIAVFAVYIVTVIIHELAHYFTARKFFYRCERIELSAFGLTLYGDFEEAVNREQTIIALSAPLVNLSISVLLFAAWYVYPEFYVYTKDFLYANLSIGFINLLPCYPLDGGKAFLGVLTRRTDYSSALIITKKLTAFVALVLFAAFIVSVFLGVAVYPLGVFAVLLFSSLLEKTDKKIYGRLTRIFGKKKRLKFGMEKKRVVFLKNATLQAALTKLENGFVYEIEIVDENLTPLAVITEAEFYKLVLENSVSARFCEVINVV